MIANNYQYMHYFNYHATIKKLIFENKLKGYYYCDEHNDIRPALVLLFDDIHHPIMPIREKRWQEYAQFLPPEKEIKR